MFALLYGFRAGYRALRGTEGLGLGDVKLAAVAGVWLGWADLPMAVNIAALSALAVAFYARFRGAGSRPESKAALRRVFRPGDLGVLAARGMARLTGRLAAGSRRMENRRGGASTCFPKPG